MVLGSLAAGGGVLRELFSYNRENFMYDREMRQKQEFQILAFRNKQAELWRDDVRDIIGMTEKKMDSYLIIATLQLGMCVGLFCEGRLEPGTPPWMLTFYMLALGGAFLYLLMAVWFAMHASVVANCTSVRLLTQFVRLPVPTWEHLEDLRTYASAYESVDWEHMLRIPFTGSRGNVQQHAAPGAKQPQSSPKEAVLGAEVSIGDTPGSATPSTEAGTADSQKEPRNVADPWSLERHGQQRDLYELEEKHPALRAHIGLARKAALQYQCFDAFARVAMTFGTNQLLGALCYYCLGYVALQDGGIWPAWCIVIIMSAVMVTLVSVDVALTSNERVLVVLLVLLGPICCSVSVTMWVANRKLAEVLLDYFLPIGYLANGIWLLWALGAIGIKKQPSGALLPTKFRAVLYLDVFGWLSGRPVPLSVPSQQTGEEIGEEPRDAASPTRTDSCTEAERYEELLRVQEDIRADIALWQSEKLQAAMNEGRFGPTTIAFGDGRGCCSAAASGMPSNGDLDTIPEQMRADEASPPPRLRSPSAAARTDSRVSRSDSESRRVSLPTRQRTQDGGGPVLRRGSASTSASCLAEDTPDLLGQSVDVACEVTSPMAHAFSLLMEPDLAPEPVETSDGLGTEKPRDPAAPSQSGPRATHTVRLPPRDIFHAASWAPAGANKSRNPEDDGDIVAGHEQIHPGRLPAKVFRTGTAVLAALWVAGIAYPVGPIRNLMMNPLLGEVFVEEERAVDTLDGREWERAEVPGVMGTDPNGLPMFIPQKQSHMKELSRGTIVDVEWPTHAGFFPRAISSDDSGLKLVVADDIGLYTALLTDSGEHGSANATEAGHPRALRGQSKVPQYTARFTRVERCSSLEGQALKDMSVVCTGTSLSSECRVMVLISRGPTLVECPLPTVIASTRAAERNQELHPPKFGSQRLGFNWTVSGDWLHKAHSENVESLAVNSDCLKRDSSNKCNFEAEKVGCVVVGTSMGRIVQLRSDLDTERQLVPDRSIHYRPTAVTHGSLHVLPSGYVLALSRKMSLSRDKQKVVEATAQAFDEREGNLAGEWKLPDGVDWLTLSGGGQSLLALGVRDRRKLELHRFPVPKMLKASHDHKEDLAVARGLLWPYQAVAPPPKTLSI